MNAVAREAQEIAAKVLAQSSAAYLNGDFDTYAQCFDLPQSMETYEGRVTIQTRDELRAAFQIVTKQMEAMGVTDFVRRILVAEYRGEDTIISTHETRLMRGTFLLREPYPSYLTLRLIDGVWKVTGGMYAIEKPTEIF